MATLLLSACEAYSTSTEDRSSAPSVDPDVPLLRATALPGQATRLSWPPPAADIVEYRVERDGRPLGAPPTDQTVRAVTTGDIALCNRPESIAGHTAVAQLVAERPNADFLIIGDVVQGGGSAAEFECYDRAFGDFWNRSHPAIGNHEHNTDGAGPYLDYFGVRAGEDGRRSFWLGAWQVITVDSNCWKLDDGCGVGSAQYKWLAAQLESSTAQCSLVYWHHPRWPRTPGQGVYLDPMFDLLVDHGVELLLTGHEHYYRRFPALGTADEALASGVTQLVIGTGGFSHSPLPTEPGPPASVIDDNTSFGLLDLQLGPDRYDGEFVPIPGHTFTDRLAAGCHGPNTTTPSFLDPEPGPGEHTYRVEAVTAAGEILDLTRSVTATPIAPTP